MTNNPFIPTTSGLAPNAGNLGVPGAIVASSTTTNTIALGTLVFTVQPQAAWASGMPIFVVDSANTLNWMWGTVSSYSGETLAVSIQQTNGSGTISTWLLSLAGAQGPQGETGSSGGGINSGTSDQLTYYGANGTTLSGNPNANMSAGQLTLGQANSVPGALVLQGGTSGAVSIGVPATAGATTFNLPGSNGTSGYIMQTDGSGNTSWVKPASIGAGLTLLATLNPSAQTSIVFNNTYITSAYNKYVLEYDSVYANTVITDAPFLGIQVSTNNGTSFITTGYLNVLAGSTDSNTIGLSLMGGFTNGASRVANAPNQGTAKFSVPSASRQIILDYQTGGYNGSGNMAIAVGAGSNTSTTAINAIRIIDIGGGTNTFSGNFHLYGLSGT